MVGGFQRRPKVSAVVDEPGQPRSDAPLSALLVYADGGGMFLFSRSVGVCPQSRN